MLATTHMTTLWQVREDIANTNQGIVDIVWVNALGKNNDNKQHPCYTDEHQSVGKALATITVWTRKREMTTLNKSVKGKDRTRYGNDRGGWGGYNAFRTTRWHGQGQARQLTMAG